MSNSKGSIERNCEQCGGKFKTKQCWIRKGFGRFCSQPCVFRNRLENAETRFWEKVDKTSSPHGCWLWMASKRRGGYGQATVYNKPIQAHRYSWELVNGSIPSGLCVLHNCPGGDNPACLNPAHLFLGTLADNSADMVKKNRQAKCERHGSVTHPGAVARSIKRGENHHNSKFTNQVVEEIRLRYALGGITMQKLADIYDASIAVIYNIIRLKSYQATTPQNAA